MKKFSLPPLTNNVSDPKTGSRYYPDAQFQLGDSVRYEQKPCHIHGFIRDIDLWKGRQFLYTVDFIDGETRRINEAFLHPWNA